MCNCVSVMLKYYKQTGEPITKKFRVESDYSYGEWVTCMREDLFTGDNEEESSKPAEFDTEDECEKFIVDLSGLMHCGCDRKHFRIKRNIITRNFCEL